jgi:hypothetical protein
VSRYSRNKYKEYKSKAFSKLASSQQIFEDDMLKVIGHPEVYKWMPSREIICKLGKFMHKPMCIRVFPRDMVFEVYDSEHPCPLDPDGYYKFRAYTSGTKATVFVDDTETPESLLWVILHELAHMEMRASRYLLKAYTAATPPDYNESDEAHERDPEEKMANFIATEWLGQLGYDKICYSRPWWRTRVDQKCTLEKDAGAGLVFMQNYYRDHPEMFEYEQYQQLRKRKAKLPQEKTAANVVALALGVATGAVAVHDYFKSRGMGSAVKTIEEEINKQQVSTKSYIRRKDPRIIAVTNVREAEGFLKEIPDQMDRDMTRRQIQMFFANKESNAFAFRGKKEYVIAHPRCNKLILDHEVGHIHDFRSQNMRMTERNKYNKSPLKQFLFKKNYREGTYGAEVAAWDQAKVDPNDKLRTAALETYDKSFHINRGSTAAVTSLGLLLYGAK